MIDLAAAMSFMAVTARPLERLMLDARFHGGDPAAIERELQAFQNDDGGFGHGLEPDKLAPTSQPLDVEVAFERLAGVGWRSDQMLRRACDWLATIADDTGAVPVLMPDSNNYPRAAHWGAPTYPPALNPTAAIVGHAHCLGLKNPWLDRATEYCFETLESAIPDEGHALVCVTKFLARVPDRDRADALAPKVAAAIESAAFVKYQPGSDGYGVTPLDYAPEPDGYGRAWFPDHIIDGHLDELEQDQQPDGGWPVRWDPPTPASLAAWRGIRTMGALITLRAYRSA